MVLSLQELEANFATRRKVYDVDCEVWGGKLRVVEPDAETQLSLLDHKEVIEQIDKGVEVEDLDQKQLADIVKFMQDYIISCTVDDAGNKLFADPASHKLVKALNMEQVVNIWADVNEQMAAEEEPEKKD